MAPRILVLGSLSIDFVSRVPHHPFPGETLTASSFALCPGGKGANQATAIAKLSRPQTTPPVAAFSPVESATVTMAGAVGNDAYGPMLLANLASFGVDTSGVKVRDGMKSGVAIIIVDEPTGENRIVLSPESNASVEEEEFASGGAMSKVPGCGQDGGGKGAGSSKPDLLVMQLEIPLPTVLKALETAREEGIPVLFNPAPAVELPMEVYKGLAHLVVNETEAAILSGVDVQVLDTEEGLEKVARIFIERGCLQVIITLGGRGTYFMDCKGSKGLVPAEKAKVVDTTAAGDTFVGMYALDVVGAGGVCFDVETAVRKANKAAKITVERPGAQASIPWRDELPQQ
ncbi:Ribokinase-like protein [Zalerion maritima]|uniref:Ribokinase n=1 Tax=Zalerion maritima TaxID=339359 RepID=A0AAD5WV41_9PEZI|nr:Ribokinase-like protein [Zalerion maritima]